MRGMQALKGTAGSAPEVCVVVMAGGKEQHQQFGSQGHEGSREVLCSG